MLYVRTCLMMITSMEYKKKTMACAPTSSASEVPPQYLC